MSCACQCDASGLREGASRALVVEFNANVPYSGPGAACLAKWGKQVAPALGRLLKFGRAWLPKGGAIAADAEARVDVS